MQESVIEVVGCGESNGGNQSNFLGFEAGLLSYCVRDKRVAWQGNRTSTSGKSNAVVKALDLYPSNREGQGSIPTFSNNIFGNNSTLNVPKPH